MHRPYDWSPSVVETQILRAGQLFILIVPGEFTTMAGRRIKAAVAASAREHGLLPEGQEPIVQISGPANTYGHYVTTREEYTAQRYEGASTLFGPHTLEAYIDIFANRLVPSMKEGARDLPNGPMAKINIENAYHFKTGVVYDNVRVMQRRGGQLMCHIDTFLFFSAGPCNHSLLLVTNSATCSCSRSSPTLLRRTSRSSL